MIYHREIDDDLYYNDISNTIGDDTTKYHQWCKCNKQGTIRCYYYIDSSNPSRSTKNIAIYSNTKRIVGSGSGSSGSSGSSSGSSSSSSSSSSSNSNSYTKIGGEFYLNMSSFVVPLSSSIHDTISITVKGYSNDIKIPYSICYDYFNTPSSSINDIAISRFMHHDKNVLDNKLKGTAYIMSLWASPSSSSLDHHHRQFRRSLHNNDTNSNNNTNTTNNLRRSLDSDDHNHHLEASIVGLSRHFEHHFCLLNITRYAILLPLLLTSSSSSSTSSSPSLSLLLLSLSSIQL